MVNERINKNYPSQATGILHAPEWKNRKWLAISSQIPTNSIIKKIDFHFVRRPLVLKFVIEKVGNFSYSYFFLEKVFAELLRCRVCDELSNLFVPYISV